MQDPVAECCKASQLTLLRYGLEEWPSSSRRIDHVGVQNDIVVQFVGKCSLQSYGDRSKKESEESHDGSFDDYVLFQR